MTEKKSKQNDEINSTGMIIIRNLPRLDLIEIYTKGIETKIQELLGDLNSESLNVTPAFHIKVIQALLDNIKAEVQASVDEFKHKEVV